MNFIKRAFGEFNKFNMKWSRVQDSVYRYDILNVNLSPSKFVYFHKKFVVLDVVMTLLIPAGNDM